MGAPTLHSLRTVSVSQMWSVGPCTQRCRRQPGAGFSVSYPCHRRCPAVTLLGMLSDLAPAMLPWPQPQLAQRQATERPHPPPSTDPCTPPAACNNTQTRPAPHSEPLGGCTPAQLPPLPTNQIWRRPSPPIAHTSRAQRGSTSTDILSVQRACAQVSSDCCAAGVQPGGTHTLSQASTMLAAAWMGPKRSVAAAGVTHSYLSCT